MNWFWMFFLLCVIATGALGEAVGEEPVTPIQPPDQVNAAKVELGRKLFHDTRLSHSNSVACSTCHHLQS